MYLLIHEENSTSLANRTETFADLHAEYLRKSGFDNESTISVIDPDTTKEVLRHFAQRWNTQENHIEIVNELGLSNTSSSEEVRAELFQLANGENGAIVMAVSVWDPEHRETTRSSDLTASHSR